MGLQTVDASLSRYNGSVSSQWLEVFAVTALTHPFSRPLDGGARRTELEQPIRSGVFPSFRNMAGRCVSVCVSESGGGGANHR